MSMDKHPTKIVKDIEQTCTWRNLTEGPSGSSQSHISQDQTVPGDFPEQPNPPSVHSEHLPESEDKVDQLVLAQLAQEGGVKFLDLLLAKAVPPFDLGSPDTSNIHEWTLWDIQRMPSDLQEEWHKACQEEIESLHKCNL